MKKPVLWGILFVALVLGVMIYSSMNLTSHRVEVCMNFNGRTNCKTVSGATEEYATQTAITQACGDIAGGVTDTVNCEHSQPTKVVVLK